MAEKTEDELVSLIEQYESESLGSETPTGGAFGFSPSGHRPSLTTLQVDRAEALLTYYARREGTGEEDGSTIVFPEMRDRVDWEIPQLMRIFAAGPVCQFEPCGPGDEKAAAIETEAVQHIFMQENQGFLILHDLVKDARMLRNGYVRAVVEEYTVPQLIGYSGLSQYQMQVVLSDKVDEKVDVLEQQQREVDGDVLPLQPGQPPPQDPSQVRGPPQTVWDLKIRRTKTKRRICIECVPPEEILVHVSCRAGLDDARYVQHHSYVTRSELIEEGYDEAIINALPTQVEDYTELVPLARMVVVDQGSGSDPADRSMQTVCKRDIYMQVDFDGDGEAELRHIILGDRKVLLNEEVDEIPYVGGTLARMPHRHTGLSAYDDLADIQAIKTELARGILDNARSVARPRVVINFGNVTMEDLMVMRENGIIRTKGVPAQDVMPMETPFIGDKLLPIMEMVDNWSEMRTGIGKDSMGLDADALQNVTKAGALAGMASASLKLELKARMAAETMIAPLFRKVHSLMRKHPDTVRPFQYRGQWVQPDPTQWGERDAVSPAVGLGSGQREEMRTNLMMLEQLQEKLFQALTALPPAAYRCAWNSFQRACQLLGFNTPEQYGLDPDSPQYQQMMQQMAQSHQQAAQGPLAVQQSKNQGNLQVEQARQRTAAIKEDGETQRAMAQLNKEIMVENQGQQHEIMAQGREHAAAMSQAQLTAATQLGLKVMDFMSRIEAAKAKNDPSVDGNTLATDTRAAEGAL